MGDVNGYARGQLIGAVSNGGGVFHAIACKPRAEGRNILRRRNVALNAFHVTPAQVIYSGSLRRARGSECTRCNIKTESRKVAVLLEDDIVFAVARVAGNVFQRIGKAYAEDVGAYPRAKDRMDHG